MKAAAWVQRVWADTTMLMPKNVFSHRVRWSLQRVKRKRARHPPSAQRTAEPPNVTRARATLVTATVVCRWQAGRMGLPLCSGGARCWRNYEWRKHADTPTH